MRATRGSNPVSSTSESAPRGYHLLANAPAQRLRAIAADDTNHTDLHGHSFWVHDVSDAMAITGLSMAAQVRPLTDPTEVAKADP